MMAIILILVILLLIAGCMLVAMVLAMNERFTETYNQKDNGTDADRTE